MKNYYADISQGQVHYRMQGDGRALLLIHQTGMSSEEYSEVIPILAEEYRVIAVDLLGYGNSAVPPADYRIEDHAGSILEFLDVLEIDCASVMGHHVGSRVAAEVAATRPERVEKLILSGCPYYSPAERKKLREDPKYQHIAIRDDGAFLTDLWQTYRHRWGDGDIPPALLCRLVAITMQALPRPYNIHDAVFSHDIEPKLRQLKCPTLLISGSKDVFYHKLEPVSRLIADCRTQVIENAGYFICLEKPVELARAISGFLNGK